MSIYVPVNMSGRLCGVGIGMVIRMNASHRERDLLTSVGVIQLEVPRDRAGEYVPEYFERYKRVHGVVDEGITETRLGRPCF